MILYFADHLYSVIGTASTALPDKNGLHIIADNRSEEIGAGFDTYTYTIEFDSHYRGNAENVLKCGNYIFRKCDLDDSFTAAIIIESETDPVQSTIEITAEDAGLDLLNGLAPKFIATRSMNVKQYVEMFIADTGYEIGLNEISDDYILALAFDNDDTITKRLLDIASYFGAEIYCSFTIENFWIRKRMINIVRERGKDLGVELREGIHLSNVIVKRDMSNVATALNPIGASPDNPVGVASRVDPSTGRPYYTWIKFADNTGGINMNDSGSDSLYIGLAVDQEKMEESLLAGQYKWRRINYSETIVTWKSNTTGFAVTEDGNTKYTWVSFSKKSDGSNLSNTSDGMSYIGIATGKDSATKSSNPADYEWFDMREGSSDKRYILIDSSNTSGVKDLEGYTWVKFGTSNAGAGMADTGSGKTYLGVSSYRPASTKSSTASDYVWLKIDEISDNGGYVVAPTYNGGVKTGGSYTWFMFTNMEEMGYNPSTGNYIGLRYNQAVATPMSTNMADYDWHEVSGDEKQGITLRGYKYDDGDIYVDGKLLKSRTALKTWARDVSTASTNFGHIIRTYECDAKNQKELLDASIKELKKVRELSVEYTADIFKMPSNVRIGDYVRIVDRQGELYLSARVLSMESSETSGTRTATFGNYRVLTSGIGTKVTQLAEELRKKTKELESSSGHAVQTVVTYFLCTDTYEVPNIWDPGWTTEAIDQSVGQYVWQMTETTNVDGSKSYSVPAEITGLATAMQVYTLYYKSTNYDETSQSYLPPDVPTSAETIPPEGWSLSEESAYEDNSKGDLYSVTLTTYSDGRFVYSDVYKVSTYSQVQSTNEGVSEAKAAAEDAKQTAVNAENHAKNIEVLLGSIETAYGDLKALLSTDGFTIVNEEQPTKSTLDTKGLKIVRQSDGVVLAQFDYQKSYVDYLKVNRFLSFGAHRTEKKSGLEYDNSTSVEGTAFFWTGGE